MTESTFSHTPQSTSSRLVIEALEAGADQARPLQDAAADSSRMTVELSDIRAWRFFEAAPQDFLHQYAGDFVIADVLLAPSFFEQALDFLHAEPQAHLCLRGRFSRRKLLETIDAAKAQSISVEVHEGAGLRALAAHIETQSPAANNPDSASLNPASGLVLRELAFAHPCADEGSAVRSIADIYGAGPGSTSSQSQRFSCGPGN